jgi:hypothetical protein
MKTRLKSILFLVALLLPAFLVNTDAWAAPEQVEIPNGFYQVSVAKGVELYRKDYPGGTPDFVQVVRLKQGAHLLMLHGEIRNRRTGQGVYGGDDPKIASKSIKQYWRDVSGSYPTAFCVFNGQFFKMGETPTRLPFPLKVDGVIVSDGYAKQEYREQKLMLELWPERAEISEFSKNKLYLSNAPNILVGLTEDARKSPNKYVGRTFIGVDDEDGDGKSDTILIFSTKSARQKDAAKVLRSFGADKVMMLDGGSSTQLVCQGSVYIKTDRMLPQVIAVIGANGQSKSSEQALLLSSPGEPDQSLGEMMSQTININDTQWILLAAVPIGLLLMLVISGSSKQDYN